MGLYIGRLKVFLRLRLLACYRSILIIADTGAKSYPSLLHLFKLIRKGQSLRHERLKSQENKTQFVSAMHERNYRRRKAEKSYFTLPLQI